MMCPLKETRTTTYEFSCQENSNLNPIKPLELVTNLQKHRGQKHMVTCTPGMPPTKSRLWGILQYKWTNCKKEKKEIKRNGMGGGSRD